MSRSRTTRDAAHLKTITRSNLSIWTPFEENDVYYASAVSIPVVPDGPQTALTIIVRCVAKESVGAQVIALAALGIEADEIELGTDNRFIVELRSLKSKHRRTAKRWTTALVAMALLQATGLYMLVVNDQDRTIDGLQSRLEEHRKIAHSRVAAAIQAKLSRSALASIRRRSEGEESVGEILARMAKQLPKDAWYREISLNEDRGGSAVVLAKSVIDPVAMLKKTDVFRVDEVNELASPEEGEQVFTLSLAPARARLRGRLLPGLWSRWAVASTTRVVRTAGPS